MFFKAQDRTRHFLGISTLDQPVAPGVGSTQPKSSNVAAATSSPLSEDGVAAPSLVDPANESVHKTPPSTEGGCLTENEVQVSALSNDVQSKDFAGSGNGGTSPLIVTPQQPGAGSVTHNVGTTMHKAAGVIQRRVRSILSGENGSGSKNKSKSCIVTDSLATVSQARPQGKALLPNTTSPAVVRDVQEKLDFTESSGYQPIQ
jgi:hypothetical protein